MGPNNKRIGVCIHIYYLQSFEFIKEQLTVFDVFNSVLFFNICSSAPEKEQLYNCLRAAYPDSFIIETPNIGKDIGGKLSIVDLWIKLPVKLDYLIFLHDKKSPHSSLGEQWKKKLFRSIDQESMNPILHLFEADTKTGIVGAKEFITNEYDKKSAEFNCTNNAILKELITNYQLKLNTYDFIGGTMFWVRAEIVESFFRKNSPLEIRSSLEKGNVLDHEKGTYTHAWERMLSWIAINSGFSIKGI